MQRVSARFLPKLFLLSAFACSLAHGGTQQVELPLPASGQSVRQDIDRRFLLRIEPADDGWDVAVVEKPHTASSPNLLYHSLQWHGPYPTEVMAWHVATAYFPNTRWVCVRNAPIEIRIQLVNPEISGTGDDARFVGGRLQVAWFRRPCTLGFKNSSSG